MQDTCALGGNPRPNAGSGPARHEESSGRYQELRQLKGGKQFYTIKEVVSTGLCSRQTLWRLMKSGELGYVKVGTRVLIPRSELISFVQSHYHKDRG